MAAGLVRLIGAGLLAAASALPAQHDAHTPGTAGMHRSAGPWTLTVHAVAFGQYVRQETQRGARQFGVTDHEMFTAVRNAAGGSLQLRLMTSLERFTLGGAGYPLLLQTGGVYRHGVIHDRQHPHGVVGEFAARYERAVPSLRVAPLRVSLYAGVVGEPALGPVPYFQRPSAADDPVAPLGHHWQDASHASAGVVTLGLASRGIRLEGSAFNARERDQRRVLPDFSGARLDSYAGRATWAPTRRAAVSAWWGYLRGHHLLSPDVSMHRAGASVIAAFPGLRGGEWNTALVWGMNVHHHPGSSHTFLHGDPNASPHHRASSLLAESTVEIGPRHAVFVRLERVMKNGEELGFLGGDLTALYDVRSIAGGYRLRLGATGPWDAALGVRGAVNFVPASLRLTYGTRRPSGFAAYTQLRIR